MKNSEKHLQELQETFKDLRQHEVREGLELFKEIHQCKEEQDKDRLWDKLMKLQTLYTNMENKLKDAIEKTKQQIDGANNKNE